MLYNKLRFSIDCIIEHPQLQVVDLRDAIDGDKILVINIYIKPTFERSQSNIEVYEKAELVIETALVNGVHTVIGGDLNEYRTKFRAMCGSYAIAISKVGYTRLIGKNEIDIVGTSIGTDSFVMMHDEAFMSDHYLIAADIRIHTNILNLKF
jgi:hypothetical protein